MSYIPQPWEAVLLTLAAYRLVRFFGWDDWPPIYRMRAWAIGEFWVPTGPLGQVTRITSTASGTLEVEGVLSDRGIKLLHEDPELELPGKQPPSEVEAVRPAYRRPLLAHLVHCPFCLSWWVCLTGYAAWLIWPHAIEIAAVPWAASGAVGVIAKNLDA